MKFLLPGVVIFAKDVARIASFYEGLFDLKVKIREADKVVLDSEMFSLVVHGIPEAISNSIEISIPPQVRENTAVKLFLPVGSIFEARVKASKLGGAIKSEDNEWKMSNFIACDGFDPEGNVFQVRQLAP